MRQNDGDNRKSTEYDEYRDALKKFKIEITWSKKIGWETLCKQVDNDPWGLLFRLVTKKIVGRKPILGIILPNRLKSIVNTLFLSQRHINYPNILLTEG